MNQTADQAWGAWHDSHPHDGPCESARAIFVAGWVAAQAGYCSVLRDAVSAFYGARGGGAGAAPDLYDLLRRDGGYVVPRTLQ